jgi:hypothetical protein
VFCVVGTTGGKVVEVVPEVEVLVVEPADFVVPFGLVVVLDFAVETVLLSVLDVVAGFV